MNRNKHNYFKEYIVTIIVTALVVFSLALCVQLELLFRCEKQVNYEELNVKNLVKFCTIEQLEKRMVNEPKNYFLKIRLAELYESLNEFDEANNLYKQALLNSERSNYSLYSYAIFCAKRNLFGMSATFAEELAGKNLKVLEYKSKIYYEIGINLDKTNQIEASTKAFQVSYKYAKNLKDKNYYLDVKNKYSKSYIKLADLHISQNKVVEAIYDLKNSLKIKYSDEALYKLGIIYLKVDKFKAEKCLSKVFKSSPYVVNPYIYNKLLNDLIKETSLNDKMHSPDFYALRLNSFKRKILDLYLYKDDLYVKNTHIEKIKLKFSAKPHLFLVFDVYNNTNSRIKELYFESEIFINDKMYKVDKKILSKPQRFNAYDTLEKVKMKLNSEFDSIDVKNANSVIIKYYARKNPKAPWTLVKIESLNI